MSLLRLPLLVFVFAGFAYAADVPKLAGIAIDGDFGDWAGRGFAIENLAPMDGRPARSENFAARAWLGWDADGFLFAVEVQDDLIREARDDLYTADSVELFLARAVGGEDRLQIQIAPGLQPAADAPRVNFVDRRKNKAVPVAIESARAATSKGYRLEGRVPWAMLGWSADGTFGVQVIVNDRDQGERRLQYVWYPGDQAFADSRQLNAVKLAADASPPERSYWRWRSAGSGRVSVIVASGEAPVGPSWVVAREGERVVAQVAFLPDEGGARAEFTCAARGGDMALELDGRPLGVIPLGTGARPDSIAVNRADYTLAVSVFSGDRFPEPRLLKAEEVERVLGPVTITARYFDVGYDEVSAPGKPGRYGVIYEVKPSAGPAVLRYQTLFRTPTEIKWTAASLGFSEPVLSEEFGLDPVGVRNHAKEFGGLLKNAWRAQFSESFETAILLAAMFENSAAHAPSDGRSNSWRRNEDWWYGLRKKLGLVRPYAYVVETPGSYDAEPEKRWPLVLFLHGSGEGDSHEGLRKYGPTRQIAQGRKFPFILVSPRSPAGPWQFWYPPQLGEVLDEVARNYRVDPDRVYVTGLSLGGFGTWRLAAEYPDRFAAIAPFCGGWEEGDAPRLARIPTWAFHGDQDAIVPVEFTRRLVEAVRRAGGEPRMTIYPGVGHGCWEEAYGGEELYDWLLAQRRDARPADAGGK